MPPFDNRTNQDKPITVHLITHSHMDAGWEKTVDEYFSGDNNVLIHATCKFILDTAIESVAKDPRRKYTIADIKFFAMWYKQLSAVEKSNFKKMV